MSPRDADCGFCWNVRESARACHVLEQCAERQWLNMTPEEEAVFRWWDEREEDCPVCARAEKAGLPIWRPEEER